MKVAVVGLGYVGGPLAEQCQTKGHEVIGIDNDPGKLEEYSGKLNLATDDYSIIAGADVVCICVPTPVYADHSPDTRILESVSRSIARHLSSGTLVSNESTVAPGMTEGIVKPLLEEGGLETGVSYFLAHCPEIIDPGNEHWHVGNSPRVVGAYTEKGLSRAVEFYESVIDAVIHPVSSLGTAEAVKVYQNIFRSVNIALPNSLAPIFDAMGIDIEEVIDGAATKPYGFLRHTPGAGVGGHCIPVDPWWFLDEATSRGQELSFLRLALETNLGMPRYTVDLLVEELNEVQMAVNGTNIGLLGLSYKPGIADIRESPALEIKKRLIEMGAKLRTFDPYVPSMSNVGSLDELLDGCDAVVLATAHKEFLNLDVSGLKVVIDGRNFLDKDKIPSNVRYRGIGRR